MSIVPMDVQDRMFWGNRTVVKIFSRLSVNGCQVCLDGAILLLNVAVLVGDIRVGEVLFVCLGHCKLPKEFLLVNIGDIGLLVEPL